MADKCIAITHKGGQCTKKAKAWGLCGVHGKGLKKEIDHLQGQLVEQNAILEQTKQEHIKLADDLDEAAKEDNRLDTPATAAEVDRLAREGERLYNLKQTLNNCIAEIIRRLKGLGVEV